MKNYRMGFSLLGAVALACGLGALIIGLHRKSEKTENARWREFFGDIYEDPEASLELWDIPLNMFPGIITPT